MAWFGGEKKYKYKIRRLTADLDTLSLTRLHWCLLIFKLFGFKHETTIRLSNSKNGRHVIAWCKHKGLSRASLYLVRTLSGDDLYRIKKDKQDRMIQILFYKKIEIEELKNERRKRKKR